MLVKVKRGYKIRSEKTGKLEPQVFATKAEAEKRVKQKIFFSHANFSKKGKFKGTFHK